jgi:hypothetical protein
VQKNTTPWRPRRPSAPLPPSVSHPASKPHKARTLPCFTATLSHLLQNVSRLREELARAKLIASNHPIPLPSLIFPSAVHPLPSLLRVFYLLFSCSFCTPQDVSRLREELARAKLDASRVDVGAIEAKISQIGLHLGDELDSKFGHLVRFPY